MMKKVFLLLACAFMLGTSAIAKQREQIPLQVNVNNDDKSSVGHGFPKSPIQPPTVFIDAYTLQFAVGHPDYILNIKDEDGDTVFTTLVYSEQTEVSLPATLSGDYEVELVMGNWKFTGNISL